MIPLIWHRLNSHILPQLISAALFRASSSSLWRAADSSPTGSRHPTTNTEGAISSVLFLDRKRKFSMMIWAGTNITQTKGDHTIAGLKLYAFHDVIIVTSWMNVLNHFWCKFTARKYRMRLTFCSDLYGWADDGGSVPLGLICLMPALATSEVPTHHVKSIIKQRNIVSEMDVH